MVFGHFLSGSRALIYSAAFTSKRRQYPNLLLPSSPVRTKANISLRRTTAKAEMKGSAIEQSVICDMEGVFVTYSPWVALHWFPVYHIWEAELRNDPELVLGLPHELEAPLQLQPSRTASI